VKDLAVLFEFIVVGLANGLVYSLVALGFTVIFNATRILNFAQGAFVMLGGMLTYLAFSTLGGSVWTAGALGVAGTVLVAVLVYYAVVQPIMRRRATLYVVVMALFGVHTVLENAALVGIASTGVSFPKFTEWPPLVVFGANVSWQIIWVAVGAGLIMAGLNAFFFLSPLGKAMRAAAANPMAARLVGIRVERMALYAFALSGGLGAVGGFLITPAQFTAFNVGLAFALKGFTAAMIGGFGNIWGATLGGIIVGLLETGSVAYLSTRYEAAATFLMLFVILLWRPHGLFSSLVEEDE